MTDTEAGVKRSHYHMTVGKETGWCHSASDDKTEVSTNCEPKGSGHGRPRVECQMRAESKAGA